MSDRYEVEVPRLVRGPSNEIVEETVVFDRPEIKSITIPYTVRTYPDYIDSLIVTKYANAAGPVTLRSVMAMWGMFFVQHRNLSGYAVPSRGDGSCFYNSIAKFIEIYDIDIQHILNDACTRIINVLGVSDAYNYYIAWYLRESMPISMKLRLIAADYILQRQDQFDFGIPGSFEEFVYTQVLEYGSEADDYVIVALSEALGMNIHVMSQELDKSHDRFYKVTEPKGTIVVIHKGKAHYDLFLSQRQMAFILHDYYEKPSGDLEKIVEYFDKNNRNPGLVGFMKTFYLF